MSEIGEYREVYFGTYCRCCKYFEKEGHEEPCNECLTNPTNEYSHRPINFKLDENATDLPDDLK